ncbi:hypothetical protein WJX73_008776 [Symbiochloris irregularis]|uniref:Mitochondrial ATPase complex subunit ATP10 n=1 Tax=Symbiochloris irregularis TaxID=706552 RepID=A0AAW1NMW3_9CHLO
MLRFRSSLASARWLAEGAGALAICRGNAHLCEQQRSIKLFEIFSKEKTEARKAKLREDLQRGYFDDFKELRETEGRVFPPDSHSLLARDAVSLPELPVVLPDGSKTTFPSQLQGFAGGMLCVAFREGADSMLQPWGEAFAAEFAGSESLRWFQLSLIESAVMRMWPFSSLITKAPRKYTWSTEDAPPAALQPEYLFHFGEAQELKKALNMKNQLTGYTYLLDAQGRVRWRASGAPQAGELEVLRQVARQLFVHDSRLEHSC